MILFSLRSHNMNREKDDSDRIIAPNVQLESSLSGPSSAGETVLKKGPWTSSEDAILVEYMREHGERNWNAVQKSTGLRRSGKSCRLRWINHLRPNLKKGTFTPEEEKTIAHLHYYLGNKWAQMTAFLPGRTDNEIKNYWNSRIRKRQQTRLPLYSASELNYRVPGFTLNTNMYRCADRRGRKVLQGAMTDFLDIGFQPFVANPRTPSRSPLFRDISSTGLASQGLRSHTHGFNAGMKHAMQLMENVPQNRGIMAGGQRMFEQLPHGPDSANKNLLFLGYSKPGSHIQPNYNFSTSRPLTGTVKVELPSLQYPEPDSYSWQTFPPPPPPYEAIHTHFQSPLAVSTQPYFASPSSSLVETFVQGSHAMSPSWQQSAERRSNYPAIYPSNMPKNLTANISAADLEGLSDPYSHFYRSAVPQFSEFAPTSNISLDELPGSKGPAGPGALSRWNTGASRETQQPHSR
ncbi:hypothetical protein M5K25_005891 [Dendrobium thyrsiflorum]|uniref:Uncharacterized protein n=1 Tax=Dendrobium thyrsiflorum TaxID=117978 RepID=A0ABD0VAB9_DENTH